MLLIPTVLSKNSIGARTVPQTQGDKKEDWCLQPTTLPSDRTQFYGSKCQRTELWGKNTDMSRYVDRDSYRGKYDLTDGRDSSK